MNRESGNYFCLPNNIFDESLSPNQFSVYCYLSKCSDRARQCYPSRRTIARNCRLSLPTVDSALKTLEEKGLIDIIRRYDSVNGNKLSNLYTLLKI